MKDRFYTAVAVAMVFGGPAFSKPATQPRAHIRHSPDRKQPAEEMAASGLPSFFLESRGFRQGDSGNALDLSLPPAGDNAEEIVVHGSLNRNRLREDPDFKSPISVGAMTFTSAMDTHLPGHNVLVVTGAIPIAGIPGLDAVVNVAGESGPHEQRDKAGPIFNAGPPVGLRFKF
jgi:hypothetical protein